MQQGMNGPQEFPLWGFLCAGLLLAAGAVYVALWLRGRGRAEDSVSLARMAAFVCGAIFLWVATGSRIAAMDHELLILHMVQHLLLSTVCAPLLLLGDPALVIHRGLPENAREWLSAPFSFLRGEPAKAIGRTVTHPLFCWIAAVGTLLAWHMPAIFELAMRSEAWHAAEQVSFFAAGILFWWPVIQPWPWKSPWPRWSIPLYLLLATMPCDTLSAFLTFCDRVVYREYLAMPRQYSFSVLQDQECAGALMWVWVTIVYLIPAVVITMQILQPARNRGWVPTNAAQGQGSS